MLTSSDNPKLSLQNRHHLGNALVGLSSSAQVNCWRQTQSELLQVDISEALAAAVTGNVRAVQSRLPRINRLLQNRPLEANSEFRPALELCQDLARADTLRPSRSQLMSSRQPPIAIPDVVARGPSRTALFCNILVRQGRINKAVQMMLELQHRSSPQDEVFVVSRTFFAELFGQFHQWEQAHKHLIAIKPMSLNVSRFALSKFHITNARTSIRVRQFAQAAESLANARTLVDEDHWPVIAAHILSVDADLHLHVNDLDAAQVLAAKSCEEMVEHQNCFQEMKAKEVLARIRIAQGELDAAWTLLEDPRVDAMPPSFRWSISPSRAQILRERKDWRALAIEHDVSLRLRTKSETHLLGTHAALWSRTTGTDLDQKRIALARLNDQLKATNEEINELLSIVSHDLRSPLLAMSLAVQMGRNDPDPCARQRHLQSALATLSRIREISAQLTTLEDLEATGHPRKTDQINVVDVIDVVHAVVARYQAAAKHKQIRLSMTSFEGGHPLTTISDPTRITQILENLVSNALKFSHPGSSIEVDVRTQQPCTEELGEEFLSIAVRDNGPGFTEAERSCLFDKYVQLGARPTNGESSSGLGLHIAQTLAATIGGYVDASSDGPGTGATFRLFVPLLRWPEQAVLRQA